MKAFLSKLFSSFIHRRLMKDARHALLCQERILLELIDKAKNTAFGTDHHFNTIKSYEDFTKAVPVRDYEGIKSYIERIRKGESNVLWPGKPLYLSKTSGTTSGTKYIPLTADSMPNHINSARNALLSYIHETGKSDFVNGKMIFLQGNPDLKEENGIKIGRLSGIVAHHVPAYLQRNRLPSFEVNCIDDWESKVEAIAETTMSEDMRLISGIPPWVQMYFEVLRRKTGKGSISQIFPNFSLLVYGGVNYKPYQKSIEQTIGRKVDQIEVYPASEGFIAFQDSQSAEGMLLNVNSGIFFEFIRAEEVFDDNARRYSLGEVEAGINYAVILSTNAGLWAYNLGDTVKFVSLNPYRIVVSGRIKHFTSAFGEHVISEEVEGAVRYAVQELNIDISEFHVAPQVNPPEGELPYHEWLVELKGSNHDLNKLAQTIDTYMQERNVYYRDLRKGNILQQLKITLIHGNGFNDYMKSIGKLGGQNKLPRLSNDRNIAQAMQAFVEKHA